MYKKRHRSSVVVKFKEVSGTVWVCLKDRIIEKHIKRKIHTEKVFER